MKNAAVAFSETLHRATASNGVHLSVGAIVVDDRGRHLVHVRDGVVSMMTGTLGDFEHPVRCLYRELAEEMGATCSVQRYAGADGIVTLKQLAREDRTCPHRWPHGLLGEAQPSAPACAHSPSPAAEADRDALVGMAAYFRYQAARPGWVRDSAPVGLRAWADILDRLASSAVQVPGGDAEDAAMFRWLLANSATYLGSNPQAIQLIVDESYVSWLVKNSGVVGAGYRHLVRSALRRFMASAAARAGS